MRARLAVLLALALALAAVPGLANAGTWIEGTVAKPFGLVSNSGLLVTSDENGDPSLTVPYEASTVFDGSAMEFEPRSVRVASDGSLLVACGKHGYVMRISKNGSRRTYTSAEIPGLERPFDAYPLDDGGMLIVDRGAAAGEGRIIRVDSANKQVWQYGGTSGLGAGQVWDPFTAEPLPGNHMLIADSLGQRVIEIDTTTGSIVWSYGSYKVQGNTDGLLDRPHSAQKLDNGDVLICDSEGQRVIEVNHAKQIVWTYGSGVKGSGPNQVTGPNWARRLADGTTMICDSENNRVIMVDNAGRVKQAYGVTGRTPPGGALSDPRAAAPMADGTTLIADLGNMRIAKYGFPPSKEYVVESGSINPQLGVLKTFTRIAVSGTVPRGALLSVEYSIDSSGTWTSAASDGSLPSDAAGSAIRYRIRLTTADAKSGGGAPTVSAVSISWVPFVPATEHDAGGSKDSTGTGGATKHTSGSTKHASSTQSESHATSTGRALGTGSNTTTASAPTGTGSVGGGTTGGATGGSGSAVTQSTTMSGWVMSEVHEDAGASAGVAVPDVASGGAGRLGRSTVPGVALLIFTYSLGIAWAPASRALLGVVVSAMTH